MEPLPAKRFSSFTYLNITQFLGVLNDNIYKLLLVFLFIQLEGIQHSHEILSISGAIFVLPFLLFSASSGTLADRFSKRNIIIMAKVLELIVTTCGLIAFYTHSKVGSFAVLGLLATQSALFGPSKYGIVPEIVPEDKISQANGLMTSFTFLAIIIGTFLASFILDITGRNYIIGAALCVVFSIIGLLTSLGIHYTPPSGSSKKFSIMFWHEIYKTIQVARHEPSLLLAILGSAYFLFLGAFIQLNIIPFAVESLGLSEVQGGYLFLLTALGIGTGAVAAGRISGKSIELGLVPIATCGITFCLYLLDGLSTNLLAVIPLLVILGFLGGMYEVPIDSYIQIASPSQCRGQIIAATNFICFIGVLVASLFIYLFTERFHLSPAEGFAVIGTITLCITVVYAFQFFDYLTRFFCRFLAIIHFRTEIINEKSIPNTPAIYVCTHTAWNDTLLMLAAQPRRLRFFIEKEHDHHLILKSLYRMLRVVMIPEVEPLLNIDYCHKAIKKTLKKGISVCIFTDNTDVHQEIIKLKASALFASLEENSTPIIAATITKGQGKKRNFLSELLSKLRIPTTILFEKT